MADASTPTTGRPSMADVGRLAQVSPQTVSRYFTGVGYVGDDTRRRIAAAIEQLGYRRNSSARAFRTQRTNFVGVLSTGPLVHGTAELLTGLSSAARAASMTLTISQVEVAPGTPWRDEITAALEHLLTIPVDGVIVMTPLPEVEPLVREIAPPTPLVLITDHPAGAVGVASIHSGLAAEIATEHLIDLGHRRIVHLAGPAGRNETTERARGYRRAMAAAGLAPQVVDGAEDWTAASGRRAADAVDPRSATAVLAANDEIALGFLSGMEQLGLHAPRDFSIIGIDDMPSAAFFSPPLTSMRLDFRSLGAEAFGMIMAALSTGYVPAQRPTRPELVTRSSVIRLT